VQLSHTLDQVDDELPVYLPVLINQFAKVTVFKILLINAQCTSALLSALLIILHLQVVTNYWIAIGEMA